MVTGAGVCWPNPSPKAGRQSWREMWLITACWAMRNKGVCATTCAFLVAEKNWEGCRGLQITDEIMVTIAAQAALMLLGLKHAYFRRVLSILVYPSLFVIPGEEDDPDLIEKRKVAAGQAWYRGPVILAWDSVRTEGRDPSLGQNLVIHEFAHQLDFLDDSANGTPDLVTPQQAERWHDVMTVEYERLQEDISRGRKTLLGKYAATKEAEFFSVASECFFTLPQELQQHHAELYAVLAEYYGVEPVRWFSG